MKTELIIIMLWINKQIYFYSKKKSYKSILLFTFPVLYSYLLNYS